MSAGARPTMSLFRSITSFTYPMSKKKSPLGVSLTILPVMRLPMWRDLLLTLGITIVSCIDQSPLLCLTHTSIFWPIWRTSLTGRSVRSPRLSATSSLLTMPSRTAPTSTKAPPKGGKPVTVPWSLAPTFRLSRLTRGLSSDSCTPRSFLTSWIQTVTCWPSWTFLSCSSCSGIQPLVSDPMSTNAPTDGFTLTTVPKYSWPTLSSPMGVDGLIIVRPKFPSARRSLTKARSVSPSFSDPEFILLLVNTSIWPARRQPSASAPTSRKMAPKSAMLVTTPLTDSPTSRLWTVFLGPCIDTRTCPSATICLTYTGKAMPGSTGPAMSSGSNMTGLPRPTLTKAAPDLVALTFLTHPLSSWPTCVISTYSFILCGPRPPR
mmetsp:Transcript_10773/g.24319  ORF Transcript_10773/g.24319 Transcript_10773/m.24319 type:complete len:377 (-) Transcript_10773:245-1375(-)